MKLTKEMLINMVTEAIAAQSGEANYLELLKMGKGFEEAPLPDSIPVSNKTKPLIAFLNKKEDKTYHVSDHRVSGGAPLYELYVIYGGRAMELSDPKLETIKGAVAQLEGVGYTGNM